MRTRLLTLALAFASGTLLLAPAAPGADPGLRGQLAAALRSPDLRLGETAAYAVDLRSGEVLFAHNATKPFVPASVEKLPIAWAALRLLGPRFRFTTEVVGDGHRAGATWAGTLVLRGHGDPTLSTPDLDLLARTIRARGIRTVTGRIVGDESFFDTKRAAPGWKREFVGGESPPLSALVVDRGAGWPALFPAYAAAKSFRAALTRAGVSVHGGVGVGLAPAEGPRLATDTSPPLRQLVRLLNAESDNFAAEMLLKRLGAADGQVGSSAGGARAVLALLDRDGIPTQGLRLVDGSGLSARDRLTALALVSILAAANTDPVAGPALLASLAVAGTSGTLDRRLYPLAGIVRGKTGTTDLSCTLVGVVRRDVAFAVLHNGTPVACWAARAAQDRFVTLLAVERAG
ncbi:MAG: D-alanyl-D-alanine carboxypeptidase/D-alanyl-D-alanine-endopeptidase [Thermoleophilia bacterium]|nr:D-alanyl-D-alanine carboxypeptidase/D-alanyl-D-alanine-endopeptidase [Thermoleophilia bacterium]